jgi:hypothetical protein
MHNHIVESIGSWGVVSTPYQSRMGRVKGGDIIEIPENLRSYPIAHRYSRIASVDEDGVASVCEGMGSAHLLRDGNCDISGGPWWSIPISLLAPKHELYESTYWNWGNNPVGAHKGIYYQIYRPVHTLTIHPYEVKYRYALQEDHARKGHFMHDEYLDPAEWTLFIKGKEYYDGEHRWIFKKI